MTIDAEVADPFLVGSWVAKIATAFVSRNERWVISDVRKVCMYAGKKTGKARVHLLDL